MHAVSTAAENTTPTNGQIRARVLRAAWLAILLGLVMEALVVMSLTGFGPVPKADAAFADTVQKTSWSSIVCAGLAIGASVARLNGAMSAMGLAGLLAAPLGFVIAPMPLSTFVARAVNELLFPVGCAGVLHTSRLLERRMDRNG